MQLKTNLPKPTLPHFELNARELFKRIYQNQQIDPEASRKTLKDQLDLYLKFLSKHLGTKISQKDEQRIMDVITRNNQVASILESKDFKHDLSHTKELLNSVALGLVFCIDGRIPAIFLGGRFASHWEVPAGEITITTRKSDGNIIPESSELCESLRKIVTSEKDLLEIVFAHTSLIDPHHGCGAMAAKRKAGLIDKKLYLEEANLKIIEQITIPAIQNIYNEFRLHKGFEPLKQIAISALYDTDTFGVILNFDKKDEGLSLSTTDLTNKYKDLMEEELIKNNLVFGSFREKFSHLKYLTSFVRNVTLVINTLNDEKFNELSQELTSYINTNYPDLNENQKKALKFFLTRTIAFQYLTGGAAVTKKTLSHPFAHHEEEYMAVSTRGTTLGKFDPESQGFSSTPADPATGVSNIKTKLSIMDTNKHRKGAYILFVCNPVNLRDLKENSIQLHKIMDANAELLRAIVGDKDLGGRIEKGEIIPVSVLIEEDTREVLKIVDHSAYI